MPTEPLEIPWHPWNADAFDLAKAQQRPVLLAIGAAWCPWTDAMAWGSYRDTRVVHLIVNGFVAVRVDADQRPDVSDRYTLGGWPTTAFLTPSGDLLGGGTYLEAEALTVVLQQVAEAFTSRRGEIEARALQTREQSDRRLARSRPEEPVVLDRAAWQWFDTESHARFDQAWAGFGTGTKQVDQEVLAAVLLRGTQRDDPKLTRIATRTLDAITSGELWDAHEGGLFRACEGRDWSKPQAGKLLTIHAQALNLLLTASQYLNRSDYADRARAIFQFVHTTFAASEGGFFTSQRTPPGGGTRDASDSLDRAVYTDATAAMASAYVHGASVFGDDSLLEFAVESMDRVLSETYEPGRGVGHAVSGAPALRGLLTDHVSASIALLDLYDTTQQAVYLDLPQELMTYCRATMWDETAGFDDRAHDIDGTEPPLGLLREPHYRLDLNCRASMVFARLGKLLDDEEYHRLALLALARQTPTYREHGIHGAAYVLALDTLDRSKTTTAGGPGAATAPISSSD